MLKQMQKMKKDLVSYYTPPFGNSPKHTENNKETQTSSLVKLGDICNLEPYKVDRMWTLNQCRGKPTADSCERIYTWKASRIAIHYL